MGRPAGGWGLCTEGRYLEHRAPGPIFRGQRPHMTNKKPPGQLTQQVKGGLEMKAQPLVQCQAWGLPPWGFLGS